MTVTYSLEVSSAGFLGFARLLFRWRGGIYKLIYRELCVYLLLFYTIFVIYRYGLTSYGQRLADSYKLSNRRFLRNKKGVYYALSAEFRDKDIPEKKNLDIVLSSKGEFSTVDRYISFCSQFDSVIPMTFVMGFYVSIVVNRWWQQWLSFPWPDRAALAISTYVEGKDEQSRKVRRSLIRYLSLTSLLVLQSVSKAAKRRFPTLQHLVAAGLLSERELKYLLQTPTPHGFYYIPCSWFAQLARQAMKDGQVQDTISLKALIDEMQLFRGNCGSLFGYDWISVPLVYTQVVTLSVYAYFGAALFGNQMIISHNETESNVTNELPHHYFPFFTILQFFFYVGWLKVAEQLINPLGEDDDDFEVNYLIDRCVQVGYLMVDDMYGKYPPLERDTYWSNAEPEIPYTEGTVNSRIEPFLGSVADVHVNGRDSAWADTQEHILQRNENQAIQHEEGKPNLPASISSRRSFLQRIFRSLDHLNMPRKTSDSSMSILPSHRKRKKFPIFGRNLSRRSSNSSDSYKNLTGRSSPQSIESNIFDDHDDCESLDSLTLEGGSQNQKAAEFGIKNPDEPSADVPTVPAENYHIQGDMGLDTGRKDSLLPTIVENETLANVQSTAYKTFNLPNNVQYNF